VACTFIFFCVRTTKADSKLFMSDLLSAAQSILLQPPDDPARWTTLVDVLAAMCLWMRRVELENQNLSKENQNLRKDLAEIKAELADIGAAEDEQGQDEIAFIWVCVCFIALSQFSPPQDSLKDWLNMRYIGRQADKGKPVIKWDKALREYLDMLQKVTWVDKRTNRQLVIKHSRALMLKMKAHYT
jgi:hypothetical protein